MKGVDINQLFKIVKDTQDKLQREMEELVVEGSSGGDMVKVKMNGKKEILSLKVDKEIVNPDDTETLEDLIMSAINSAMEKVDEAMQSKMPNIPGMNIPGLF